MNNKQLTAIEKRIMNQLLDAYERKKEDSDRRVIIKANKFPDYDLDQVDRKQLFIRSSKHLRDLDFIRFDWVKHERENLLDRIILLEDKLINVYDLLGRQTKADRRKEYLLELEEYEDMLNSPWVKNFLKDERGKIAKTSKWSSIWPKGKKERLAFVYLLKSVEDGPDSSMRYLSVRLYNDSKKLEKHYRNKLISVARKYIPLDLDDEAVLDFLGVMLNPSEILVYGPLTFDLLNKSIKVEDYLYGSSINSQTVKRMNNLSLSVKQVLTIENKATYYEYIKNCPDNVFVVYLGGFFGKTGSEFLQKLKLLPDISFFHWSDIDLGGFRIFRYLQTILGDRVQPIGMDKDTYESYLELYTETERISDSQVEAIKGMLSDPNMECLRETMEAVVYKKRRLEQECIAIHSILELLK